MNSVPQQPIMLRKQQVKVRLGVQDSRRMTTRMITFEYKDSAVKKWMITCKTFITNDCTVTVSQE